MSLDHIRKEIDTLDDAIIALLERRFELVAKLLPHKNSLTDTSREAYILKKTASPYVQAIYREVFQTSKQLLLDLGFKE